MELTRPAWLTSIRTLIDLLGRDGRRLFATRMLRLFAYDFLSVILVLYLSALGFADATIGLLLSLTLLGDTAVSLWITTHADRVDQGGVCPAAVGRLPGAWPPEESGQS